MNQSSDTTFKPIISNCFKKGKKSNLKNGGLHYPYTDNDFTDGNKCPSGSANLSIGDVLPLSLSSSQIRLPLSAIW